MTSTTKPNGGGNDRATYPMRPLWQYPQSVWRCVHRPHEAGRRVLLPPRLLERTPRGSCSQTERAWTQGRRCERDWRYAMMFLCTPLYGIFYATMCVDHIIHQPFFLPIITWLLPATRPPYEPPQAALFFHRVLLFYFIHNVWYWYEWYRAKKLF